MKFKLFNKFFLTTTIIILTSLTFITIILSFFISNYLAKEKRSMLYENCNTIAAIAADNNFPQVNDNLSDLVHALAGTSDADIIVVDKDGTVLACGCEQWYLGGVCNHSVKPVSKEDMDTVLNGKYSETGFFGERYTDVHYTEGVAILKSDGKSYGAVFASLPASYIKNFFGAILRMYFISSLIPIIIMFFAEYIISYRFTKPLRLMSEAARSMAKGDFSKRIPVNSDDEIGELSIAFNQMTNALVQLESMRRRFVANVSHELKTPMTTIGGFIDGILDGTINKEQQHHYLGIASGEVKRLSRLVQSMLSLAKLESGEQSISPKEFNLAEMVFKIVVSQEQRIDKKSIEIQGLDQIAEAKITADYDLIYQVVYNLVDNAIKFTDKNGYIAFSVTDFGNFTQFTIRNSGEGINEEDLPFVFERFYKADKSRSAIKDSTGLGLYIAKTIITIHGGKVLVNSIKNEYTEFAFMLPNVSDK